MREYKKRKCWKCIPLGGDPLVVSGRGYTEYEIDFCRKCGRVLGDITKDYENIYSVEKYPNLLGKEVVDGNNIF